MFHISNYALLFLTSIFLLLWIILFILARLVIKLREQETNRAIAEIKLREAQQIKDKDILFFSLKKEHDVIRSMAVTAIQNLELAAKEAAIERGQPIVEVLAAIVPEAPTPEQIEAADTATLRAKLTAATLALGLPARTLEAAVPQTIVDEVRESLNLMAEDMKSASKQLGNINHG